MPQSKPRTAASRLKQASTGSKPEGKTITRTANAAIINVKTPKPGSIAEKALTLLTSTQLSPAEVARQLDTDQSNISHICERYGLHPKRLQAFKNHRADILAGFQQKILSHINEEKLKSAPAGTLALMACQLYDKERLERDMSTQNVQSVHADIAALRALKVDKPVDKPSCQPVLGGNSAE